MAAPDLRDTEPMTWRGKLTSRRRMLRGVQALTLATVGAAIIALGLFAKLLGAPDLVAVALAIVGVGGVAVAWARENERDRLAAFAPDDRDRSREAMENLADRMWELQESEERFRGLVDALGDLVVHRDREGRIVYANRVFAGLLDRKPAELTGRTLAELGVEVGVVPDAAFAAADGNDVLDARNKILLCLSRRPRITFCHNISFLPDLNQIETRCARPSPRTP